MPPDAPADRRTRRRPGILPGLGLGGFVDGIALRQIARWHGMGSAIRPPTTVAAMPQNARSHGWTYAASFARTLAGVRLLLRDARAGPRLPTPAAFTGQLLLGWAVLDLVELTIDHHRLGLHHMRDMPVHVPLCDRVFVAVGGVGLIALAWLLARRGDAAAGAALRGRRCRPHVGRGSRRA